MVDLLIKNVRVLAMDAAGTDLLKGAVAVNGDRIHDIGESAALEAKYPSGAVIDGQGMVALPGLINTHMHVAYSLLKGIASDIEERVTWLSSVYPYVTLCGPEECYRAARLGCLEMLMGGITYFVENNPYISDDANTDAIARAVEETGIRAAVSRMFSDINAPSYLLDDSTKLKNEMRRLHDRWHGAADGRIQVWVYSASPGLRESPARMEEILQIVRSYGGRVTCHWAEGGEGRGYYRKQYGAQKATHFLEAHNFLGPDILLVHTVHLDDEEIGILARSGTPVAHCPVSNTIRAGQPFAVAPVREMLAAGVTVGLGTDACICNDKSSLFEAMKQAVLLQKLRTGSPAAMTARQALQMATVNGAKIVGLEQEIGSLETGKKADIILLNLNRPHILPLHNIYENIVYCASETDVDTVIVNGRVLMRGRQVMTLDVAEVMSQAVSTTADLDRRAAAESGRITAQWQASIKQRG